MIFKKEIYGKISKKIGSWEYLLHSTKRKVLMKFLLVLLILFAYLFYVSSRFGAEQGLMVSLLTWSLFVFCTPVADAGILIDFPVRFITHLRMVYSEIIVWIIATILNLIAWFLYPSIYTKTILLTFLHNVLSTPWPFWSIILLSAIGTFFSIIFADELVDVAKEDARHLHNKHHKKHHFIIFLTIVILTLIIYDFVLNRMGIHLPLF